MPKGELHRRAVLAGGAALALAAGLPSPVASATPAASDRFLAARAALLSGRTLREGGVVVDIPRLAENGTSVPLRITVESPMTAADHVRTIHVLSEQNPIALIARFHLGPKSGRAEVQTAIRLATTQNVHVIAEMSDGTLRSGAAECVVMLAACLDGG